MRYSLTPSCGAYGHRLWVEHNVVNYDSPNQVDWTTNIPDTIKVGLNRLCTWGGCDKQGQNYMAWEFPPFVGDEWRLADAVKILEAAGYKQQSFDLLPTRF